MLWKYSDFLKTEAPGICFRLQEDQQKMGSYESPLMLDVPWATHQPSHPSCKNMSMVLVYPDCGESASSLLLEHHRTLRHHLLLTHSLQGPPP